MRTGGAVSLSPHGRLSGRKSLIRKEVVTPRSVKIGTFGVIAGCVEWGISVLKLVDDPTYSRVVAVEPRMPRTHARRGLGVGYEWRRLDRMTEWS